MIYGTVGSEVDKLDISAFPVNEKAKVEIVGNENFVVGENTVKIIVTSENSKIQKTYTLKLNKEEVSNLLETNLESENKKQNSIIEQSSFKDTLSVMGEILKEKAAIILLYMLVWIEFLQVVYLYERLKKFETKDVVTDKRNNEKDSSNK